MYNGNNIGPYSSNAGLGMGMDGDENQGAASPLIQALLMDQMYGGGVGLGGLQSASAGVAPGSGDINAVLQLLALQNELGGGNGEPSAAPGPTSPIEALLAQLGSNPDAAMLAGGAVPPGLNQGFSGRGLPGLSPEGVPGVSGVPGLGGIGGVQGVPRPSRAFPAQ